MVKSSLAIKYIPAASCNHWGQRKETIKKFIVHHVAGVMSAENIAKIFSNPSRGASATYVIGNDGEIICCLSEKVVPGTSGGYEIDKDAVTVEVSNSKAGEPWTISDKALNSLILLAADVAKRNECIGKFVKGKNLCWHSMYAATVCPGNYLRSKMDYIAKEANKLNEYFDGTLAGNDVPRRTDDLVLYFKGLTGNGYTGTNQWGYEVAIDKNGVVLEDPHYSGNTKIPTGGKVLSGHGKAGEWIAKNIKKGYTVWFDTSAHVSEGVHRSVDTFNGIREANFLAVYNKGSVSNTNIWGWEVAVNAKGTVTKKRYDGKTPIPEGGFVLSGHGDSASWIDKHIKIGNTVIITGNVVTVK